MANDNKDLIRKNESLFRPTAEDILDNPFENLDRQQTEDISRQAAEEAVRIAVEKKRSEQKFENAQKDISTFVDNANRIDQASRGRDYSMSGSFESASGTTNVQISKQNSKMAIIIAVVVGLVLLIFFLFGR